MNRLVYLGVLFHYMLIYCSAQTDAGMWRSEANGAQKNAVCFHSQRCWKRAGYVRSADYICNILICVLSGCLNTCMSYICPDKCFVRLQLNNTRPHTNHY